MEAVILFFVVIGLLVALPIVFSRLGALSAKQQKQQQHIDFLQQQLGDLWRKGYAPPMVNRIVNTETSAACEENPGAAQRQTVPAPSLQQPAPLPAFSDGRLWPAETPVPAPQMLYPPYPPARQPVYQAAQPNYQTAQLAAYRQQATASQATAPQVTAPQAAEVPDMSPPVQTQAPAPAVPVSPRARTVTENWIGRNVLGVAASILVFVGLIFLGRLIYEHITDTIKIILMFALSTVLTGVGVALSAKKRNAFTVILTGCGCGAFFISIMLTHIYFGRMNDIAAFSLLLAWTAATLFAARQIQSVAMSVVAHIGMIVSICFAYALGLSDEKLALLIVYQMVSSAVIVGGNILCCKKTYRFGVFLSLVLTLVAGVFMWVRFWPASVWQLPFANTGLSSAAIAAAFIAQFVCASFLSYLLSVSTNRLQEETVQGVVHLGNKLLWIAAFVLNGYLLVYRLAYAAAAKTVIFVALPAGQPFYAAIAVATAAGLAVLLLHAALTLWMGRKLQFHRPLETLSVLLLSAVAGVLLFVLWVAQFQMAVTVPRLIWLLPLGALLLLAQRVSHNKAYGIAANVFFGIDLIFMLAHGYAQLTGYGTVALSVGYMCLYLILIAGQWLRGGAEHRKQYSVPARVAAYLVAEVSLVMILLRSSLPHKGVILLLTMTALNLLLLLFRYDGRKNGCRTGLYWLLRANEWLWIAADAVCIVFIAKGGALTALYAVLAVLAAALALLRVKENLWKGINAREEALYIVKINALAAGVTLGFSMDSPYRGALLLLVMTALCIVFYALRVWLYRRHGLDSARAPVDIALRIYEGLWLLAGILCIALVEKGGAFTALYTVLAIFTAALALLRIKRNLWDNIRAGEEALYLVKISALAAGFVLGFTMDSPYRGALLLLAMTALCIVFYALRGWLYRRHELDSAGAPVDVVLRIYEGLWFIADVACIAFVTKFDYTANALYLVLAALALGLIAVRARGLFTGALHAGWQVWLGIQLTALIMATVFGHTYWFDNTYVVSLMCMLTALAAIVVGFLARAQYLRLYGLVLTLLCVLKLVTYDVAGLDTVLRVVTLISGGVICFAISALYSYSVKKINAARGTQEEKDRETETKTE